MAVLGSPTTGLAKDAGTILLLHFNGTAGSTLIYDEVSATNLPSDGVVLIGDGSAEFGTSALPIILPSSGFSLQDFTAEFIITIRTGYYILLGSNTLAGIVSYCVINEGVDSMSMYLNGTHGTGSGSVPAGEHHIAFTKYQGSLYFHLNGIKQGGTVSCANVPVNFNGGCIGSLRGLNAVMFTDIMHECRITNYARYTTPTITVGVMINKNGENIII